MSTKTAVSIEVFDHLPRWAYTKEEWQTDVIDKTYYLRQDGIRFIKTDTEPEWELDIILSAMMD